MINSSNIQEFHLKTIHLKIPKPYDKTTIIHQSTDG